MNDDWATIRARRVLEKLSDGAAMNERVEEIRRRQRPWRMDDIETLLAALAQAEREGDEARAERNARARDVMHLEAEVGRLKGEITEADEATARMFNLARDLRDEMEGHAEQAEALLARVRAALERYGEHTMRCNAWGPGPAARECTCGLRAALEGRG